MTKRKLHPIDKNLPAILCRQAKKLSREDKSRTYQQHLNALAKEYGHSYESLLQHLDSIEKAALDTAEALIWADRFRGGMEWGSLPKSNTEYSMLLPVMGPNEYPMAHALIGLFRCGEGPREQYSDWIPSLGEPTTRYVGEELRIPSDDMIFAGLVMSSRGKLCGEMINLTLAKFEVAIGCRLEDLGMPLSSSEISRTLWRLTHSTVSVPSCGFEGSLLMYADARHAPDKFSYRFNPEIARLYFSSPLFGLFASMGKG